MQLTANCKLFTSDKLANSPEKEATCENKLFSYNPLRINGREKL